jgi:hypothetical protein
LKERRMPGPGNRTATLLFTLLLPLSITVSAKGNALPYALAVEVGYGAGEGEESFREELEIQLVQELQREGCFQTVSLKRGEGASRADLMLLALIHEVKRRDDYDISIAQRDSPYAQPEEKRRMVSRIEVKIELQMLLLEENVVLRRRMLTRAAAYRPRSTEDPSYEVSLLMIDKLVRDTRKFAYRDGKRGLRKEIENARGGH